MQRKTSRVTHCNFREDFWTVICEESFAKYYVRLIGIIVKILIDCTMTFVSFNENVCVLFMMIVFSHL